MKIVVEIAGLTQAWLVVASGIVLAGEPSFAPTPAPRSVLFNAPLRFEANRGQAPADRQFIARWGAGSLLLSPTETIFYAPKQPAITASFTDRNIHIRLSGANPGAAISGSEPSPTRLHYLTGNDPQQWHTDIPTFAKVKAAEVYPGIDVVYYGREGQLEYDFNLAPYANPQCIHLAFNGIDRLEVDAEGNLIAQSGAVETRQHRPVAYQIRAGIRHEVAARYSVSPVSPSSGAEVGSWIAGFELGTYDSSLPLVIDPVISFASYLGGSGDDQAYGVAVDSVGCVYVTGQTASSDFASTKVLTSKTNGLYDVFVTKYSADFSEILYSTIVGGASNDRGFSIALDSTGSAVVVGTTSSTNFPVKNAFQPYPIGGDRDAFLFKLAPNGGSFVFSTYLGGSVDDDLTCVTVDRAGNICAGGGTSSTNFPVLKAYQSENHGGFDGVMVKFSPTGILKYSTYIGGSGPYDTAIGIAVDKEQCVYLTGYASSSDFPVINAMQPSPGGGYDAFVTKFNPEGSGLVYSTLLGGSGDDVGRGIAVDNEGNAYVAGDTFSTNFPTLKALQAHNAGHRDVFISKLGPTGMSLLYSTYFGGSGEELASLTVDPSGSVWLVGLTTSTNLPLVDPIQKHFGGGMWDAFVARLSQGGDKLAFSSYVGGSGNDQGASIALDRSGNAYIVGASASTDLTTVKPLQTSNRGGIYDAFVMRILAPAPAQTPPTESKPAPVAAAPVPPPNIKQAPELPKASEPIKATTEVTNATIASAPLKSEPVASPTTDNAKVPAQPAPQTAAATIPPPTPTPAPKPVEPAIAPSGTYRIADVKEAAPTAETSTVKVPANEPAIAANKPASLPAEKALEETIDRNLASAPPPANWPKNIALSSTIQPVSTAPEESLIEKPASAAVINNPAKTEETKPASEAPAPPKTPIDPKWLRHPLMNTNLVIEGDAETAVPSASSYKVTAPPGWTVTGNLTALRYGTIGGFPTTNDAPMGGKNFFAGGPDSAVSMGTQTVNVAELAPAIDAGQLACAVSGLFGSMSAQKDNATLEAVFKDAEGHTLAQVATSPILPSERDYRTRMLPRSATAVLPPQTRAIEIRLVMKRVDGNYNDAYADNLSVVLSPR